MLLGLLWIVAAVIFSVNGEDQLGQVAIFHTAGSQEIFQIVSNYFKAYSSERYREHLIEDTNPCVNLELLDILNTKLESTLIILIAPTVTSACRFKRGAGSVIQFTRGENGYNMDFEGIGDLRSSFRLEEYPETIEIYWTLRNIIDAMLYFIDQRVVSKRNSDDPSYKKGSADTDEDPSSFGLISSSVPIWVFALVLTVFVLLIIALIVLTVMEYRKSKRKQELPITPEEENAEKAPLNRPAPPSKSLDEVSAAFPNDMKKAAEFVIKESNEAAKERTEKTGRDKEQSELELPSEWNDEPASLEAVLPQIHKIIKSCKSVKKPRKHDSMPGKRCPADVIAEALCGALEASGLIWESSPAFADLERVVMNWIGAAFGLPAAFRFSQKATSDGSGLGGGCIQSSAIESTLVTLIAAVQVTLSRIPDEEERKKVAAKLTAYTSTEADNIFAISCRLAGVQYRFIQCDADYRMDVSQLEKQIEDDIALGLNPFFVQAVLGTRATGASDDLSELDAVVKKHGLWLHVDAPYAGNSLICMDYRHLIGKDRYISSITVDPHALLLYAPMGIFSWSRNRYAIKNAYPAANKLLEKARGGAIANLQSHRPSFRALKAYILIRLYGVLGLQHRARKVNAMAARMMAVMKIDPRIEIIGHSPFSVFAFAVAGEAEKSDMGKTYRLCAFINKSGEMTVALVKPSGRRAIRICINREYATEPECDESWSVLKALMDAWEDNESRGHLLATEDYKSFVNLDEVCYAELADSPAKSPSSDGLDAILESVRSLRTSYYMAPQKEPISSDSRRNNLAKSTRAPTPRTEISVGDGL